MILETCYLNGRWGEIEKLRGRKRPFKETPSRDFVKRDWWFCLMEAVERW